MKLRPVYPILILLLLLPLASPGQEEEKAHGPELPESYFTEAYTPHDRVQDLLLVGDTLWVGSRGGILLLDAYSGRFLSKMTVREGLLDNSIQTLALGDSGSVWIGTPRGLTHYRRGAFRHYSPEVDPVFEDIRSLAPGPKSGLWFGTFARGAGFIRRDSLHVLTSRDTLLDDRVESLLWENPRRIWFGTGAGLCRIDSSMWDLYDYGKGVARGNVIDLESEGTDTVWVTVERKGIARLVEGSRPRSFHVGDGIPTEFIRDVEVDSLGRVWAGGLRGGLRYFNGSAWVRPRGLGDALDNTVISSMESDRLGNLWVGTWGAGVYHHRSGLWASFLLPPSFPATDVRHIFANPEGTPLFLTSRGVLAWEEGTFAPYPPLAKLDPFEIHSIDVIDGEFWISGRWGIVKVGLDSDSLEMAGEGFSRENVLSVCKDRRGRIWLGTHRDGAWCFDGEVWLQYTTEDGLSEDRVERIVLGPDGSLWASGGSRGVSRFRGGVWKSVRPAGETGLGGDRVDVMISSGRGEMLFAGEFGVSRLMDESWRTLPFPSELEIGTVSGVGIMPGGDVWVGSRGKGLFRWDGLAWTRWGRAQGFPEFQVQSLQVIEGALWVGTHGGGVFRIRPVDR